MLAKYKYEIMSGALGLPCLCEGIEEEPIDRAGLPRCPVSSPIACRLLFGLFACRTIADKRVICVGIPFDG